MKKVLVIGSTVCDVIINVTKIPEVTGDENIISQKFSIGGCAYNVASILKYFDVPFDLFSPVGKGIYGDFVKQQLNNKNIPILLHSNQNNGCCYCIVDKNGERTFLCEHGAEYFYKEKWFDMIDCKEYDFVYICGLEIEEKTGNCIIDFLEKNHFQIIFATGPRINHIDSLRLERIFKLHPIIHLNKSEILSYTHQNNIELAALELYHKTSNTIIVTLGENGCYYYDGQHHYIDGFFTDVVNTIGAGDSHAGTFIAELFFNKSITEAIIKANEIASLIVSQEKANL